ncbi:MAG TPA: metallophosphoesterase [Abditibacterium sp.]
MKRREFLKWAGISGAAATAYQFRPLNTATSAAPAISSSSRVPLGTNSMRFLVFGDWGAGNSLQKSVARAMSAHCVAAHKAKNGVDFAISTGDNFYNDGVKNPADAQWETKFEAMYPATTMPFPFYAVLGNHDWRLDPNAQLLYGQKPKTRWNMDGFYYSRNMGRHEGAPLAEMFFFDTDLWLPQYKSLGLGDRQERWLAESLAASTAKWKFLVGHHPPFSDGAHALSADLPLVRARVESLCQKHGADAMFSGHDHDMQRIKIAKNETQFVVIGAGGAGLRPRATNNYGPFYRDMTGGFVSIELDAKTLRGQFHDVEGTVLHSWEQKPRAA